MLFFSIRFCQSCCRGLCYDMRIDDDACAKTQSFSANDRTQYTNDLNLVPNQYFALQAQCRFNETDSMQNWCHFLDKDNLYAKFNKAKEERNSCQTFGMLKDCWNDVPTFIFSQWLPMDSLIWMPFHELLLWNCRWTFDCCCVWIYEFILIVVNMKNSTDSLTLWRLFDIKMERKLWFLAHFLHSHMHAQ